MADEWRESTWGEEISLEYGKALRGYDPESGAYRVFGSNGPIGWHSESLTDGPGVILGRKGAYRGVQFWRDPFWVIDTAYYVVPKMELDHRWLYYAIKHYKLGEIDDGSPIPSTTRAAVYVKELQVPPLREQQAIACILGALDDKIELNRRRSRTLEAMARAIFQSWFVDFDPVKAKAAGRTPPGLSPALAALFPDSFTDSPLGPIPKGWRVATLGDLLILQRGFDLPTPKRVPGRYPVIAASGENGMHNEYMVRGPGVTTGRSGVLGRVFFVAGDYWPLNTSLWVKEFKECTPVFAFHQLSQIDFGVFNAGSAVPTLNRNHVHNLPVAIPPRSIVDAFDKMALASVSRQSAADEESRTLAALRDALLPKLISGELRVPDAERIVGRAV
jgi:type I restriction enzyme S subunit